MVTLVVFLNLFCVPVVSLWIYGKRHNVEPELSISYLMQYAILVACNVPLTKIGVALARKLLRWDISIDSGYYTLLALMAASVLPMLLEKIQAVYLDRTILFQAGKKLFGRLLSKVKSLCQKCKVLLTKRSMKYKQKLLISVLLIGLTVIAYIIRKPLELYAVNANEFLFVLSDFLPWLFLIAVAVLAIAGCLVALLPDIAFRLMSVLLLWFGLASWLQDLFLNKELSDVNGGAMNWVSLGDLPENNLMVWFALLLGTLLLCIILNKKWFSFTKILAGGLCLVQLIAVGSVFINMPDHKRPEIIMSGDEQMCLAPEDNVIVFVWDCINPHTMSAMLEQYPEATDIIKDFIYYDNVNCNYYGTFPSFTHFLTGNELDFEPYAEDWQKESWESERCKLFYQRLKDNGYTCRINFNTSVGYVFGSMDNLVGKFDNIREADMRTNTSLLMQKLLKLSAYCCLPYAAKPSFEVLTPEFDDVVVPIDVRKPIIGNAGYLKCLRDEGLSINSAEKNLFTINYLVGIHPPCAFSSDGSAVESSTPVESMRGLLVILEEYCNQLKSLGLYDSSTIIIMGDHGDATPEGFQPAFLIKKSNETMEHMVINSAPVDYNDFQATIMELIGQNDGSFGTSFFDWNEGDERRRIVYARIVDGNGPHVEGSRWNLYHGYVYYRDTEELCNHIINDEPDIIEVANKWYTAPW